METPPQEPLPVKPQLGLWDAVSIIVGIIIGVGIFRTPGLVFGNVPGPWQALAAWGMGGLFALAGALCFAELASAYPRSGGEYVYLTRAFGPLSGFLFAWSQLVLIRTGSIAALAYVFADYAGQLWEFGPLEVALLATAAIAVLSIINILGVRLGTRTQNVLTIAKVIGLMGIVVAGLCFGKGEIGVVGSSPATPLWLASAMIFVLWTYSGWHEAAYIVMEIRNRRRNVPLALFLGTVAVALIYLLVNGAILWGLGFEGRAPRVPLPPMCSASFRAALRARAMTVLVMISALGAINGMIFTSARIYAEMGADHRLFAFLGQWNLRWGTPARSLIFQGILSSAMALGVGLAALVAGHADPRRVSNEGFEAMVDCTAAVFWLFFFVTASALIVLRFTDRDSERPFRVPGYPVVPLAFSAGCAFMVYSSYDYAPVLSRIGLGLVAAGIPVYLWSWRGGPRRPDSRPSAESSVTSFPGKL